MKLTVASFFSGIGGFDLAFDLAGFQITMQCEISAFCNLILEKHWPDVPRFGNIKELLNADVPPSDVWVAGFPCQDVSLARAGKRLGLRGARTGLFYEFARLLGEARPRVFVLENVHGLLHSHGGRDFGTVIQTVAKLGYSVGWRVLNSKSFGVPQSRQRVYIVGCHRDREGPGKILFEPERSTGHVEKGTEDGKKPISPFKEVLGDTRGTGPVVQRLAYCLCACSARHTGTDWSRTYISYPKLGRARRLTPVECEGVMGFPAGWTLPPDGHYQPDDVDTLRYEALGNAVTPPVVYWLANRIDRYFAAAESQNTGLEANCG